MLIRPKKTLLVVVHPLVKKRGEQAIFIFVAIFHKYTCSILYVNGLYTVTIQHVWTLNWCGNHSNYLASRKGKIMRKFWKSCHLLQKIWGFSSQTESKNFLRKLSIFFYIRLDFFISKIEASEGLVPTDLFWP